MQTSSEFVAQRDAESEKIDKLEKQLAWYKSFFDNASDAVLVVQPETWSVLDANLRASVLLGLNEDQIIGSTIPQFRRIFKLLVKSASPTILSELSLETPEGEPVMLEVSARFVEYNGHRLIQAIARDVTEQRALTDKLVQADKMVLLGQLSAGVAHEIRNPLAAINLNLQLLGRRHPAGSDEHPMIDSALLGVQRISRIVESTLDFSRSTLPITRKQQINAVIVNSVELVSSTFKRKTIKVAIDLADNIPDLMIDTQQIQQVFINMLTNAADSIKARGEISIRSFAEPTARGDGTMIVVTISDTGVGIRPDDLSKIFNPFFTRKADGTGLGLPISQRIIHEHQGVIDVESVVGEGTTFYVKFPVPGYA